MPDAPIIETERWFLKRGLPHFIADYSPTRDVLTRAVPLLTLIFLFEVANAPSREFPIWLDVVALAVGFGILLGAWILANRIRERPLLARPVDVGVFEIAVFVLAPPAIPLVFGGQWRSALATALGNFLLLLVIFLGTSYGVVPMTRWAGSRTVRELEQVMSLLVRALPLLILFMTFIFLQNEAWQITAQLHGPYYGIVLGLFVVIGVGFSVIRLPRQIGELSEFESWDVLVGRVGGTPAQALVHEGPERHAAAPPLTKRQWGNVALVFLFSQFLQVLLVCLIVFAFLFMFGVLVVTEPVARGFLDAQPHVLASLDLWGRDLVITEELLRVTGFLTVFSGLYFAVTAQTDEAYRREFIGEILEEMRRSLAVRAVYLEARNPGAAAAVG
ncbi:MAG TPA: hypothetical protein VKB11_01455 [Acidimicrobiia bacterium]|nr:hypothetical protein [Acidimicrobiia bacterium]